MDNFGIFIAGGSIVAYILIELIKGFIKKYIAPRFGDLGVNIALFIISLLFALFYWGGQFIPKEILSTAGLIFSGAITIYQVLFKSVWNKAIMGELDYNDK